MSYAACLGSRVAPPKRYPVMDAKKMGTQCVVPVAPRVPAQPCNPVICVPFPPLPEKPKNFQLFPIKKLVFKTKGDEKNYDDRLELAELMFCKSSTAANRHAFCKKAESEDDDNDDDFAALLLLIPLTL